MNTLTTRERQVLLLISEGYSRKQIAHLIHLSHHTVNDHVKHLQVKLGAENSANLVRRGFEEGFLENRRMSVAV